MKFGLHFINANKEEDWIREPDQSISIWETAEEAEKWRKSNTVIPSKYSVKKITKKIIDEDKALIDKYT